MHWPRPRAARRSALSPPGQLLAVLAILVATGGALALSAADHQPNAAANEQPVAARAALDGDELARISVAATPAVGRRVERLRRLRFDRIPRPRIVEGEFLTRIERRELRRTRGAQGLAADEAVVRMLGLLEADEQLEGALASSGELAAAAYDPRTDRLYVISDAVGTDRALVEFLLAHELTHALEDQRFGLRDRADLTDEQAIASIALNEGTATSIMVDYASRHLDPLELFAGTGGLDSSTGDVPRFVLEQLEWTYLGGMRFVNALLAGGWKLVDYALSSRPPASTEQVLHPEKYVRDERPAEVAIGARELRRRGWRRANTGEIGEYLTRQLLELGAEAEVAREAAAGWDGDRYELWRREVRPGECAQECRSDLALVLRWRWETPTDGREFARAAGEYATLGLSGEQRRDRVFELPGGYLAVAPGRRESALVFAPDAATARAVAREQVSRAPRRAPG